MGRCQRRRPAARRPGQHRSGQAAPQRRNRRITTVRSRSSRSPAKRRRVERRSYFRTSLYDYQKVRAQARYQALKALRVTGRFYGAIERQSRRRASTIVIERNRNHSRFSGRRGQGLGFKDLIRDPPCAPLSDICSRRTCRCSFRFIATMPTRPRLFSTGNFPKVGEIANAKFTAGGSLFIPPEAAPRATISRWRPCWSPPETREPVRRMALLRLWRASLSS